jgi:alpha-mannosidase
VFFSVFLTSLLQIFLCSLDFLDEEKIITVHLVPHSHDDAGWLYTFMQYYKGKDRRYCVECELNTLYEALQANPKRTFSWCEISFFRLWYDRQPDYKKNVIKNLVRQKRLEFVGGSWVMHDEASTYYQHIIDNIRVGLRFLKEEFNYEVRTAWMLDTFGHSTSNVDLI